VGFFSLGGRGFQEALVISRTSADRHGRQHACSYLANSQDNAIAAFMSDKCSGDCCAELRGICRKEAIGIGKSRNSQNWLSEFARQLHIDPSNLSKMIAGKRKVRR